MIGKYFKKDITAFIFITILTIITLVYGFSTIPSANKEQSIIADQQRVVDLGELQSSIDTYFQTNSKLPSSLSVLTANTDDPSSPLEKTDPLTRKEYSYKTIDVVAGTYELCATFSQKSPKNTDDNMSLFDSSSSYSGYADQFPHPAGYHCFSENENGGGSSDDGSPMPSDISPSVSPIPSSAYPGMSDTTPTPSPSTTAQQRDTQRNADVNALLNAIDQYAASNGSNLPSEIVSLPVNTPVALDTTNFHFLCSQLVPAYLPTIPVDPTINNGIAISSCSGSWTTGYEISRDASSNVTVSAPYAETEDIDVSR